MSDFIIKDSGKRAEFESGMVRDTEDNKIDFTNLLHGPMLERWASHLTKAKTKYPDVRPGVPNWTLAEGPEELARYRRSLLRHVIQYLNGDTDEDHAAAIFFNVNGAEYVKDRMDDDNRTSGGTEPGVGMAEDTEHLAAPGANIARPNLAARLTVSEGSPHHGERC